MNKVIKVYCDSKLSSFFFKQSLLPISITAFLKSVDEHRLGLILHGAWL